MREAFFVIGDTEGYYDKFVDLQKIAESTAKSITLTIFAGDIVGAGPQSIELLRWCYENQERVKMILGNKDNKVQRLVRGEEETQTNWIQRVAKNLDRKENKLLQDFFMRSFIQCFIADRFIVSHARPIYKKPLHKHSPQELSGVISPKRPVRKYIDEQGRISLHGHNSREGYAVQIDKQRKPQRVCLDSGAGKSKGRPLTGALIGHKQETLRTFDTQGMKEVYRI